MLRNRHIVRMVAPLALLAAQSVVCAQPLGKSEPSFKQPSLAPGVDYVVPSAAAIKATLDRVRDYFIGATPYHIIDTSTGKVITDLATPIKSAGIDEREGQFNDWDYPMGVVLAAMLLDSDVTGDARYRDYTFKNFAFIFDHLEYFKKQAELFGRDGLGPAGNRDAQERPAQRDTAERNDGCRRNAKRRISVRLHVHGYGPGRQGWKRHGKHHDCCRTGSGHRPAADHRERLPVRE